MALDALVSSPLGFGQRTPQTKEKIDQRGRVLEIIRSAAKATISGRMAFWRGTTGIVFVNADASRRFAEDSYTGILKGQLAI